MILESEAFTLEKVKFTSNALVAIWKFSSAMVKFHDLLKIVAPKEQKVEEMSEMLNIVRKNLKQKWDALKKVEDRIEDLERQFREKVAQEEALQAEIDDCNQKLQRASKLINGLEGEKVRWTNQVHDYGIQYNLLPGNCLLASGVVGYAGPFIAKYREILENLWRDAIKEAGISL